MRDSSKNSAILDLRNLCGGWGPTTVVEGVTFSVQPGETVAIIGRNGVGKSTLLELIMGRAVQHAGVIKIGEVDISGLSIYRRALQGLRYVPQEREVFPSLTVKEHLTMTHRPGRWNENGIYELFPSLARRRSSTGRQLSGGEQQMLAIARALIANPKVLLMDEPSEGLAPVIVEQLVKVIQVVIADDSLSVLLVEQRVDVAMELSTRCLIMDRGRVVHEGLSEALRNDPAGLARLIGLD